MSFRARLPDHRRQPVAGTTYLIRELETFSVGAEGHDDVGGLAGGVCASAVLAVGDEDLSALDELCGVSLSLIGVDDDLEDVGVREN